MGENFTVFHVLVTFLNHRNCNRVENLFEPNKVKATFEQSEQLSTKSHPSSNRSIGQQPTTSGHQSQSVSRSHSMKSSSTAVFPPPPSSVFEHEIIPPPQNHPPPQPMKSQKTSKLTTNEQQEQPFSSNNNTNTSGENPLDQNPIPLPQPHFSANKMSNIYDESSLSRDNAESSRNQNANLESTRSSLEKRLSSPDSTPSQHIPPPVATLAHPMTMSHHSISQPMSHSTMGANSIHASPMRTPTKLVKRAPIPPQRSTAPPSVNTNTDEFNHIFHESPA